MARPVLVVMVLLVAVEVFFVCFPEPTLLIWPDSIGYLGPGADAIILGQIRNWNISTGGFMYPLMVWGMLSIAPEPWAIVYIQRLVVLATFLLLCAACWWLWTAAASDSGRRNPYVGAGLMTFWLSTFVLYPPVIGLGQSLMAEVLFSFVLMLVLCGVVAIAVPSVPRCIRIVASWLTPFLSVALLAVKPHWLFGALVVPVMIPFLVPPAARWTMV